MRVPGKLWIGVFLAAAVIAFSLPAAAAPTGSPGLQLGGVPLATHTAPVFVHFKPKAVSGAPGGAVTISAVVKNNGTFTFTATSCNLWFRLGSSGAWTKDLSCLSSSDFPHTFSAHSSSKFHASESISIAAPPGVYEWKIQLRGTYHGVSEESHSGVVKVTIT